MAKRIYLGFLILVILSASFYVLLPEKIRIDVGKTRTLYSVFEDGKYVLAATEYINVWDGSKKMRAKNRSLSYLNESGIISITRKAFYKDEIITIDEYTFDTSLSDIIHVPIEHTTECINCVGKILQFEYKDISYEGEAKVIESPFHFGHNMKLEWEDAYLHKIYTYKFASPKIRVRYRPTEYFQVFHVKLTDPPLLSKLLSERCIEWQTRFTDEVLSSVTLDNGTGKFQNVTYKKRVTCTKYEQILTLEGKEIKTKSKNMRCSEGNKVICDSNLDGNGDGICKAGESCIVIDGTKKSYLGNLKVKI